MNLTMAWFAPLPPWAVVWAALQRPCLACWVRCVRAGINKASAGLTICCSCACMSSAKSQDAHMRSAVKRPVPEQTVHLMSRQCISERQ